MERDYWLQRKRSHVVFAREAATSEIRLIHLDLAGRYSVKAAATADGRARSAHHCRTAPRTRACEETGETLPQVTNYEHLEIGARWLASRTKDEAERQVHLGMANRYARLRAQTISMVRH